MAKQQSNQRRVLSTMVNGVVYDRFKLVCTAQKRAISEVIEELLWQYVEDHKSCFVDEVRNLGMDKEFSRGSSTEWNGHYYE